VAEYTSNCQLRSTPSYDRRFTLLHRIARTRARVFIYGGGYGRFMNRPICPSRRFSRAHPTAAWWSQYCSDRSKKWCRNLRLTRTLKICVVCSYSFCYFNVAISANFDTADIRGKLSAGAPSPPDTADPR